MTVHHGDCIEVMATFDAESIDAIVTDPPYGLGFMGKAWDHGVPGVPFWAEMLRVAKPGAHLLAFGGTRTMHRITTCIEDAGWEIRDTLVWAYASGFPKSLDVSKAIDKMGGSEAEQWQGWGTALKPAWEPIVLARKPLRGTVAGNVLEYGTGALNIDGCRIASEDGDTTARTPVVVGDTAAPFGRGEAMGGNGSPLGRWPANVILTDSIFDGDTPGVVGGGEQVRWFSSPNKGAQPGGAFNSGSKPEGYNPDAYGDSGTYSRFFLVPKAARTDREPVIRRVDTNARDSEAGISRGASAGGGGTERAMGTGREGYRQARQNQHPTVKPTELMRHLVRLVTPPGGTVLDPFLGSGSTALAAEMEGFEWVGIEREAEYVAIAEARLNGTQRGLGLDVPAPTPRAPKASAATGWNGLPRRAGPEAADILSRASSKEVA